MNDTAVVKKSSSNSLRILLISLFLGLGATAMVYSFLQTRILNVSGGEMVPVVYTNAALTPGQPITAAMLKVTSIPRNYLHYNAILSRDSQYLVGQTPVNSIEADRPLLWSDISMATNETMSQKLSSNERALTIPVNSVSGLPGFVQPGDRVDILATANFLDPKTGKTHPKTKLLLQNVTVLAVGSTMSVPTTSASAGGNPLGLGSAKGASVPSAPAAMSRTPNNMTLKLTPDEATLLAFAEQKGELRILLRSRVDVVVRDVPDVDLNSLASFNDVDSSRSRQKIEGYPTVTEGGEDKGSAFRIDNSRQNPSAQAPDAAQRLQEIEKMRTQMENQNQGANAPMTPDLDKLPPDVRAKFLQFREQQVLRNQGNPPAESPAPAAEPSKGMSMPMQ